MMPRSRSGGRTRSIRVERERQEWTSSAAADVLRDILPLVDDLERGVQAMPMHVNPATEALYIANPLSGRGMTALFSTHPPIAARIAKLRALDAKNGIHY